ncbi:3-ketodihydrosphingosine reductase [Phytophthora megakarya]|uniref:3-dehydrosphinganine reductase n=1 Tax=Phytophthora megakarya TaxID=4795 RepID=A0A225WKS9_9STRA|nr:3-ketodihydrosphingosine reductase [Phytophthora megakarya]
MAADLWWVGVLVAGVVVGVSVVSFVVTKLRAPGFNVEGKHVFITGGSSGLGLALAKKYVQKGAKVSIVARGLDKLEESKKEIEGVRKGSDQVFIQSCDVADFSSVQKAVDAANKFHGRATDHVVCSAGFAAPGYFMDQDVGLFKKIMDVNYFGTLHTIKAALPAMVQRSEEGGEGGHIVLVSSGLGLISWIGYAQYAAPKYALRGLSESLRNELKLFGIRVSIFYPGNIDSPGFVEENRTKPPETKTIEGVSEPLHPDKVAQSLINGVSDGQFSITNDPMIFILRVLANGVAPRFNTMLETALLPLIIPIQVGFGFFMDFIVWQTKCAREKKSKDE